MFFSKASRWVALGSIVAVLTAAGIAVAADGDAKGNKGERRGRFARHLKDRRERMARALDRLDALTDEQARTALEAAQSLGKLREEVRGKAAAILLQAHRDAKAAAPEQRTAIRQAAREKLKALREQNKPAFLEAGMRIVKSLTPEQRATIEAKAKEHGKTVDDAKLAGHFGKMLSRPMAAALLRARLESPVPGPGATPPATAPANK